MYMNEIYDIARKQETLSTLALQLRTWVLQVETEVPFNNLVLTF